MQYFAKLSVGLPLVAGLLGNSAKSDELKIPSASLDAHRLPIERETKESFSTISPTLVEENKNLSQEEKELTLSLLRSGRLRFGVDCTSTEQTLCVERMVPVLALLSELSPHIAKPLVRNQDQTALVVSWRHRGQPLAENGAAREPDIFRGHFIKYIKAGTPGMSGYFEISGLVDARGEEVLASVARVVVPRVRVFEYRTYHGEEMTNARLRSMPPHERSEFFRYVVAAAESDSKRELKELPNKLESRELQLGASKVCTSSELNLAVERTLRMESHPRPISP
jgi:hypothetical protein